MNGGEASFYHLAKGICELGHDVSLYGAPGSLPPHENCRCRLRYIPGTYSEMSYDREWLLAEWFYQEILANDYVLDCSLNHPVAEWAGWYGPPEHQQKIAVVLNGVTSHVPRCGLYNTVVGSQKWKELLVYGRTQFFGTSFEAQYGAAIQPVPEPAILGIVPFSTDVNFYTPGDRKEDYLLFLSRPTAYKGLAQALELVGDRKLHLKIVPGLGHASHTVELEQHRPLIEAAISRGATIDVVAIPQTSQHHVLKRELYRRARALLAPVQCFTPGHLIRTNRGLQAIETISIGDQTWGGTVQRLLQRDHKGAVVKLSPSVIHFPLVATAEHPILVKTDSGNTWLPASSIRPGMNIGYSVPQPGEGLKTLQITKWLTRDFGLRDGLITPRQPNKLTGGTSRHGKGLPESIAVTPDFLRLSGLFLAEGSYEEGGITFNLGYHEDTLAQQIKEAGEKAFRFSPGVYSTTKAIRVKFSSALLPSLFEHWFGRGSAKKHLPPWSHTLDTKQQAQLLRGAWEGDGYLTSRAGYTILGYSTLSQQLAMGMVDLLLTQGIRAYCSPKQQSRRSYTGGRSTQYHIVVTADAEKLSALIEWPYRNGHSRSGWQSRGQLTEGVFWVPVRKVETLDYAGPVYDLTVSPEHTYSCNGFIVHNCHEPFGLTLIEALACGTPVIASRMGAFPEIIKHGVTGFLCKNKAEYLEAIDQVGDLNPQAPRADAEARWHYVRAAQDYMKLLET